MGLGGVVAARVKLRQKLACAGCLQFSSNFFRVEYNIVGSSVNLVTFSFSLLSFHFGSISFYGDGFEKEAMCDYLTREGVKEGLNYSSIYIVSH